MRRSCRPLVWTACCLLFLGAASVRAASPTVEAERLHRSALERLTRGTFEARRSAIGELEQAVQLAPQRIDIRLDLARTYEQAGFQLQSRLAFQTVARMTPEDARGRLGLAQAWRQDWMKYHERASLDRAIENFAAAGRLDPAQVVAWLQLSALELERGDPRAARAAAEQALASGRSRSEALLAAASAAWRLGRATEADSLFARGLALVRGSLRERYDDLAPLVSEQDSALFNRLDLEGQREWARRFWVGNDPDLATPENEARLEYWARVTQALLLFHDPARRAWDERGEVYVRYGPPDSVLFNPVQEDLYGFTVPGTSNRYPVNALRWSYPRLGLVVLMHDRSLRGYWELPVDMERDRDPRPSPDSVAASGLVATTGLRGLFPPLPPRTRALPVDTRWVVFADPAGGRSRLLAAVSTPGGPVDSLTAEFVLFDSTLREVARERRRMSPSACDAAGTRAADFSVPLAAGAWRMGLSVRGPGGRGAAHEEVEVLAPDSAFGMSGPVVTCGTPLPSSSPAVRLDLDPQAQVGDGEPLVVYFELHHLTRGAEGAGRFEYRTSITSADPDRRIWFQRWLAPRRQGEDLGVTREDEVAGGVRRQFVSVPVQSLPQGRYRIEVLARDLVGGGECRGETLFTRVAARSTR